MEICFITKSAILISLSSYFLKKNVKALCL